jgi:alkylated DNA repair dioxygenase AlkB
MEYVPTINGEYSSFRLIPNVLPDNEVKLIKKQLEGLTFKDGQCISGKEIPRQQLWFQDENRYFCEKWKYRYERWTAQPHKTLVLDLQVKFNKIINHYAGNSQGIFVNSTLINKYRNGNDTIKPHRDCPQSFGEYPTIGIYSVGAARRMVIRKVIFDENNVNSLKPDRENPYSLSIPLTNNSLFIMSGASQKYFTHEIEPCETDEVRYSLTYRELL